MGAHAFTYSFIGLVYTLMVWMLSRDRYAQIIAILEGRVLPLASQRYVCGILMMRIRRRSTEQNENLHDARVLSDAKDFPPAVPRRHLRFGLLPV